MPIARISESVFGQLPSGEEVKIYSLVNNAGTEARFLSLGASWIYFKRPTDSESLVLGTKTLNEFTQQQAFLGSMVGRYANRIGNGTFSLDGKEFSLEKNQSPHHLHGGSTGFAARNWHSNIQLLKDYTPQVTFTLHSADGEGGYPGNVDIKVIIQLTHDDSVNFEIHGETDRATILNLTNHAYFNLAGQFSGSLAQHEFQIHSDHFLEADDTALPTGELINVHDTPFNLKEWSAVQNNLHELNDERLAKAEGYDHCYCYDSATDLKLLASARNNTAGVQLDCHSTLPGMQFYTGNFLSGTPFSTEQTFNTHGAFCFEPGYWPDSPNKPHFPQCKVDSDNPYFAIIRYSFKSLS